MKPIYLTPVAYWSYEISDGHRERADLHEFRSKVKIEFTQESIDKLLEEVSAFLAEKGKEFSNIRLDNINLVNQTKLSINYFEEKNNGEDDTQASNNEDKETNS